MGDCTVTVDPGVCRMHTVIKAKASDDMMSVVFEVESDCAHVRQYAERVKSAAPLEIMASTMVDTPMYAETRGVLPHAACPIPCAVIKAMEVAAGLGLRRDVHMSIERARPAYGEEWRLDFHDRRHRP